jgi:hypothetical protein
VEVKVLVGLAMYSAERFVCNSVDIGGGTELCGTFGVEILTV